MSIEQLRKALVASTIKWPEMSLDQLRAARAAYRENKAEWNTLPHLDRPNAPDRFFRAIGPAQFQVICIVAGNVVRGFNASTGRAD